MAIQFPGRTAVIPAELSGVTLEVDEDDDIYAHPEPSAALLRLLREFKAEVVAELLARPEPQKSPTHRGTGAATAGGKTLHRAAARVRAVVGQPPTS